MALKRTISFLSVIPAKAGIQKYKHFWTPAFAGVTAQAAYYGLVI